MSAVSNSGSVVRVAEAIQAARKHGAFALGITGKRESLLGQSVDKIMDLNIPPFEAAPGTRSYMISVMSLLLVAIRIGEVRGCYTMDEAMKEVKMVVEGVYSAKAAMELATKYQVEMPIVEQVNKVLFENKSAKDAVAELMLRDKKVENSTLVWEA